MLRRYRFELILILLIICAVVATRFFLIPIVFSFLPPPSAKQIKHLDRRAINRITSYRD